MWLTFGAVHQTDHIQIVQQIWNTRQVVIPLLPIDPIPLASPSDMLNWFMNHQALHNAMNAAVGLGGFDLSYVDLSNREQASTWIEYNALEHQRIAAVLAGFVAPTQPPLSQAALQAGTPILPGNPNVT